ncbi:unnamed protein product, partial [Effrenium voratum]
MVNAPGSAMLGPASNVPSVAVVNAPGSAMLGPASNAPSNMPAAANSSYGQLPLGQSIVMPPGARPAPGQAERMGRLQQILQRFEVSIAEANDLTALEDYEIVLILDDSGSMNTAAKPPSQRTLFEAGETRWDELKQTVLLLVELACCFDRTGVDMFFLNRGLLDGVQSASDPRLVQAFQTPARGSTPLTEALRTVAQHCQGERPILLMIFTVPRDRPPISAKSSRGVCSGP